MKSNLSYRASVMAAVLAPVMLCSVVADAAPGYLRLATTASTSFGGEMASTRSTYTDSLRTTDRAFFSLGNGVAVEGAYGVGIAEHLSLEFGFGYFYGLDNIFESSISTGGSTFQQTHAVSGRLLRFRPRSSFRP